MYQFQDYFVVSCKTGYNLMEVRSFLHSLQPYSVLSSGCVFHLSVKLPLEISLMATSCNFCFFFASLSFLPMVSLFLALFLMQLLFHAALVEDERQRSQEKLINKKASLEGCEIRLKADVTCLPCHPIARAG